MAIKVPQQWPLINYRYFPPGALRLTSTSDICCTSELKWRHCILTDPITLSILGWEKLNTRVVNDAKIFHASDFCQFDILFIWKTHWCYILYWKRLLDSSGKGDLLHTHTHTHTHTILALYVWIDIEERLRNHYCRATARSIIYSECVFVTCVIQYAKRMPLILSSVACPGSQYFSTLSNKRHDILKTFLNIICVPSLSIQL